VTITLFPFINSRRSNQSSAIRTLRLCRSNLPKALHAYKISRERDKERKSRKPVLFRRLDPSLLEFPLTFHEITTRSRIPWRTTGGKNSISILASPSSRFVAHCRDYTCAMSRMHRTELSDVPSASRASRLAELCESVVSRDVFSRPSERYP